MNLDLAQIRELLEIVAKSGVAEVEIEEDDFKLTVRKNAPNITMQQGPPAPSPYAHYGMPAPFGASPAPGGEQQAPAATQQQAAAPAPQQQAATSPSTNQNAAAPEAETSEAAEEGVPTAENEVTVPAPIVGTFYRRPSPDEDPYVEVGDHVEPGDVLCIIEAMKLMNEIECETAGTIKKILAEDAQPVEYEQPLFVIEKE